MRAPLPASAPWPATALALVLVPAMAVAGCARPAEPVERPAGATVQRPGGATVERPAGTTAPRPGGATTRRARPDGPAPAARPLAGPASLPPVVHRVPTRDKVVFLTYDDTAERDARFLDLVRELRLPVTLFLTDRVTGPGYARFARLRSAGARLQNHTLDHTALRGLPYAGQRAEICGQQHKLRSRFGVRPRLLRPPYGAHDTAIRRAAADCGISAVVLWRASAGPAGRLTFTRGPRRLLPGDVIAVAPDEPATPDLRARTTRLLRTVREEGLRVARLEDYF